MPDPNYPDHLVESLRADVHRLEAEVARLNAALDGLDRAKQEARPFRRGVSGPAAPDKADGRDGGN